MCLRIVYFEIFFLRERFLYDHSTFFNPVLEMFCNFLLRLNMATHRQFCFCVLYPETEKQIKLTRNKVHFDLYMQLSKCDNNNNNDLDASTKMSRKIWQFILFESPWYSLIASSISIKFDMGFTYSVYRLNRMHYIPFV